MMLVIVPRALVRPCTISDTLHPSTACRFSPQSFLPRAIHPQKCSPPHPPTPTQAAHHSTTHAAKIPCHPSTSPSNRPDPSSPPPPCPNHQPPSPHPTRFPPHARHPQRFYMVMDPLSPPGGKARLVVVPKKRLPDQSEEKKGRERFYAFVEATRGASGGEQPAGGGGDARDGVSGGRGAGGEGGSKGGAEGGEIEKSVGGEGGQGGKSVGGSEGEKESGGSGRVQEVGGGGEGPHEGGGGGGTSSGAKELIASLGAEEYETKTRGVRHQGAARLLAEAVYVIGKGGKR